MEKKKNAYVESMQKSAVVHTKLTRVKAYGVLRTVPANPPVAPEMKLLKSSACDVSGLGRSDLTV